MPTLTESMLVPECAISKDGRKETCRIVAIEYLLRTPFFVVAIRGNGRAYEFDFDHDQRFGLYYECSGVCDLSSAMKQIGLHDTSRLWLCASVGDFVQPNPKTSRRLRRPYVVFGNGQRSRNPFDVAIEAHSLVCDDCHEELPDIDDYESTCKHRNLVRA